MNNDLLFDFTVDKTAKTVFISREFDADLSLVWDAFTKSEILDQWVAPKPWTSKTKYMDFKVGGRRVYAMVSQRPILNCLMLLQTKMKTLYCRVLIGITLLVSRTEGQKSILRSIMNLLNVWRR